MLVLFIDMDSSHKNGAKPVEEEQSLIDNSTSHVIYNSLDEESIVAYNPRETRLSKTKWFIGITASVVSGIAFGLTNTPVLYVMDNYEGASQNMSDYTFSLSCGILLSSTFFFVVYSFVMKNRPLLNNEVFLPSLLTG